MARPQIMSPDELQANRAAKWAAISAAATCAPAPRVMFPGHPDGPPDYCDAAGYDGLKAKIAAHWPGQQIRFRAERGAFDPAICHARIDLRSDMVNGLPREMYEAAKAKARTEASRQEAR